jgi:hypothetical protein
MKRIYGWALVSSVLLISAAHADAVDAGGSVLAAPGGRYVYGQVGILAKSIRLLDTQTGRLWSSVCIVAEQDLKKEDARCVYQAMEPVFFRHKDGSVSLTPDGTRMKEPD